MWIGRSFQSMSFFHYCLLGHSSQGATSFKSSKSCISDYKIRSGRLHITLAVQDISLFNIENQREITTAESQSQPLDVQLDQILRHSIQSQSSSEPMSEDMILSQKPPPSKPLVTKSWESSSPISVHQHSTTTVCVTTSLSTEKCDRFCQCQCHARNQIKTPRWAKGILGAMSFQSNSTVLLNRRPCNLPALCRRSGKTSAQFTYYAPSWVLSRAFHFTVMRHEVTGISASVAIKIPRIITGPSIIWRLISTGSVGKIQEAFSKGLTSIYDVGDDGESLLHVG